LSKIYYDVSSVTNAMRGKSILERNGIRAVVNRTIDKRGKNGCGYSLGVSDESDRPEQLLTSAGIRVRARRIVDDNK
jgi:hypothetical protein